MANPTGTAGADGIAKGDAVYQKAADGKWYLATSANAFIAVVAVGGDTDDSIELYPFGDIDCDTHSWASSGLKIYIDDATAGLLTTTAQTGIYDPMVVGITRGDTESFIFPSVNTKSKGLVGVYSAGSRVADIGNINFVAGANATITCSTTDSGWANVSVAATGTLAGVPESWYNVKAAPYSAIGNGVNDDTAEIQAAINAASGAGGGTVYFPKGTYKCASILSVPSNITLKGAGMGVSTLLAYRIRSWTSPFIYLVSKNNIEIADLTLTTENSKTYCSYAAITIGSNCSNITLRNCEVSYFWKGITPDSPAVGCSSIKILNNYIHDIHPRSYGYEYFATGLGAWTGCIISGNYLKNIGAGHGAWGIYLADLSDYSVITNNVFVNCYGGIQLYTNNYTITGVEIVGNTMYDVASWGIVMFKTSQININSNFIAKTAIGINTDGTPINDTRAVIQTYYNYNEDILINGNTIYVTIPGANGISIEGSRNQVTNNKIIGSGTARGIRLNSDKRAIDTVLSGNNIYNYSTGIALELADATLDYPLRTAILNNYISTATKGCSVRNGADYVLHRGNIYYNCTENWNDDSGYGTPTNLTNDTSVDW